MTFDGKAELERATNYISLLFKANAHIYDPSDPLNSRTLHGMLNYLVGVVDTLDAITQERPLTYPEDAITGLASAVLTQTDTDSVPFNLPEEEERARAFYDLISKAEQPEDITPEKAYVHVMTIGILTGIVNALAAAQGKLKLDYDLLLPDTAPLPEDTP